MDVHSDMDASKHASLVQLFNFTLGKVVSAGVRQFRPFMSLRLLSIYSFIRVSHHFQKSQSTSHDGCLALFSFLWPFPGLQCSHSMA